MVLHYRVQVLTPGPVPCRCPLRLVDRVVDLPSRHRRVAPGVADADSLLEEEPCEQAGPTARRGDDQALRPRSVHQRAVDRQRRWWHPLRARHPLHPHFAGQPVDRFALRLWHPIADQQGPPQHHRRDRLRAGDLLQHGRRRLAHRRLGVEQQQGHCLAQHRVRRQAEFVGHVGAQLGRHQHAGLGQPLYHHEGVVGRSADLVDQSSKLLRDFLGQRRLAGCGIDRRHGQRLLHLRADRHLGHLEQVDQLEPVLLWHGLGLDQRDQLLLVGVKHLPCPVVAALKLVADQLQLVGEQPAPRGEQRLVALAGGAGGHGGVEQRPQALRLALQPDVVGRLK
jgi:hypothetical protein